MIFAQSARASRNLMRTGMRRGLGCPRKPHVRFPPTVWRALALHVTQARQQAPASRSASRSASIDRELCPLRWRSWSAGWSSALSGRVWLRHQPLTGRTTDDRGHGEPARVRGEDPGRGSAARDDRLRRRTADGVEVGVSTCASYGEKSPLRHAQRNGYRDADWEIARLARWASTLLGDACKDASTGASTTGPSDTSKGRCQFMGRAAPPARLDVAH